MTLLAAGLPAVPPVSAAYNFTAWAGATAILILLGRVLHDRSFRYLAATLVLFAGSRWVASLPPEPAVLNLVVNLLVIASSCAEICFFRIVQSDDSGARSPRLRREVALAVTVALISTLAWLLAPASSRSGALAGTGYAHDPAAFTFVVVIIGYYVTVTARVCNRTRRLIASWLRSRPPASERPDLAALGFSLAHRAFQLGVVIIGVAELVRFVADLIKIGNEVTAVVNPSLLAATMALSPTIEAGTRTGHTAFYVGALLPLLAGLAQTVPMLVRQARDHRTVGPLWQAVTAAFPDLAFRPSRSLGARLYRREIEIRDGLVLLRPFYDRELADRVRLNVATDSDIALVVALIRGALRAHHAGRPVTDAHPLPVSGTEDRDDDFTWLVHVAAAFAAAEKNDAPLVPAPVH